MKDLEEVYDNEISPLMKQILDICKKHEMPMFAEFQFNDDGWCKSRIPGHPIFDHFDALSQSIQDQGVNIDKYMFYVAKRANEEGHSSIVLSQLGIPHVGERNENQNTTRTT
ncbi:MAG: hypothetical protein ABUJ92_00195 [Desulfobacterales bacterium]